MKKSATYWRKKCVAHAKNEAKERDGYACVRCGRSKQGGFAMHGSHIYPEGTYVSMSADTDNLLCLCYMCHFQWWHKNPLDAAIWFKKNYPELLKKLRKRSQKSVVVNWEKRWKELK